MAHQITAKTLLTETWEDVLQPVVLTKTEFEQIGESKLTAIFGNIRNPTQDTKWLKNLGEKLYQLKNC